MKNTSRQMYNIGNIVNVVSLILWPILFLVGLIVGIAATAMEEPASASAGWSLMGYAIYFTVISILSFVFVGKAKKELQNEGNKNFTPYIVTIVFGALSGYNVFYVLAGIFGIIAESKQGNAEQPKEVEEKPAEEEKAE